MATKTPDTTPDTFPLTDAPDMSGLTDTDLDRIADRLTKRGLSDVISIAAKNGMWYVTPDGVEIANANGVPGEFPPAAVNANVALLQAAGLTVVLFFDDGGLWNDHRVPAAHVGSIPTDPTTPTEEPTVTTKTAPSADKTTNGKPAAKPKGRAAQALDALKDGTAAKELAEKEAAEKSKTDPKGKKGKKAGKPPTAKKERVQKTATAFVRPKGVVRDLPLKELTFDKRLQSRQSVFDEETVLKYADIHRDNPDLLPPIDAIDIGQEDADARKLKSRYVVWDGFQRGEARLRAGIKDIKVSVAPGTWDDALRLSLGANSTHGLPRTHADLRKSFQRLMDNESMLKSVLATSEELGGANRALAAAVGISKGLVSKILNGMGLTTRGDKIVNLPKPKADDDKTEDVSDRHQREGDPTGGLRVESKEAIASRATSAIIREMQMSAAQLQRRYESLLERQDVKAMFREIANTNGVPIKRDENPVSVDGKTELKVTEYWPAVDVVLATLDTLNEQFAKMNTSSTV